MLIAATVVRKARVLPPPSPVGKRSALIDPATLPSLPYHVHRTASQKLPIYHLAKRGGNLHQTRIRKIQGNVEKLREEIVATLALTEDTVVINRLTGHIIIKVPSYVRTWRARTSSRLKKHTCMRFVANRYRRHRVGTRMTSKDFWRRDISNIRYRLQHFVEQFLSTQVPLSIESTCAKRSAVRSVQTIDIPGRLYVQANLIRYSLTPCPPTLSMLARSPVHALNTKSLMYIKLITYWLAAASYHLGL